MINGVSEFIISLYSYYLLFIFIFILNAILFYFLFKEYVYSLIDHLSVLILSLLIQTCVLIYISILFDNIKVDIILYCYFSNLFFFLGYFLIAKKITNINFELPYYANSFTLTSHDKIMFVVSFFLFIICKLYILILTGIQVGSDEQLSYYRSIPLGGLFIRIINITATVTIVYCLIKIIFEGFNKSKFYSFLLFIIFLFELTSAGKSLLLKYLLYFVLIQFIYSVINDKKFNVRVFYLFSLAIFSYVIIVMFGENDLLTSFYHLFYRILMYGDIYMFILIGNPLEYIDINSNGFFVMIKDFLGFFRFYDWSELPKEIGNQIYQTLTNSETVKGPNPLHVFFSYIYFGWFGLIFSLISGLLIGISRSRFLKKSSKNFSNLILYILVITTFISFSIDPSYGMQNIVNILFIYIPIYIGTLIIAKIIILKR